MMNSKHETRYRSQSPLKPEELQHYARHLALPEVGFAGQEKLRAAKVALVGAGGLGTPAAMYLAAAGVGHLGIIDDDRVDASNLQRQVLYGYSSLNAAKAKTAAKRLQDLNPHVEVVVHQTRLTAQNAKALLELYDVVVDGSDNFSTRYLVNDACVLLGKPNVYASISRFDGQVSLFLPKLGPCYRCLFPAPPAPGEAPSCAEGGVLGVLPGLLGVLQATETIKHLLGLGTSMMGRLLLYDALDLTFRELKVRRDPSCPICSDSPTITTLEDITANLCGASPSPPPASLCTSDASQDATAPKTISAPVLAELRQQPGMAPMLIDVREPYEWQLCRIEGAVHLPLGQLANAPQPPYPLPKSPGLPIVVYCKSGLRSAKAAQLLQHLGYTNVSNLEGGILAWRERIEPHLARY